MLHFSPTHLLAIKYFWFNMCILNMNSISKDDITFI